MHMHMSRRSGSGSGNSPGRRPVLLELRSSKAFIVSSVAIAVFTDIFLYGVIVPVVPYALQSRVGVALEDVQYWVSVLVAIYGAFLLVASFVCGYIGDLTSTRRAPLIVGLFVLAGATGMLCAGTNIPLWIVGRALQGVSAAVVWTTGLALLVDTVGKTDVGQYLGYIGLSLSLAILTAPLLGGVVYDRGGYYAVFAMCFALIGLDVFLRLVLVEKKVAAQWLVEEPVGREQEQDEGNDAENDVASTAKSSVKHSRESSVASSPTLAESAPRDDDQQQQQQQQHHAGHRLSRAPPILSLLKSRRLLASLWGSLVQAALLTAFDSVLTLRVRYLFGWSSLGAGLMFLPIALPSFLSPIIGYFSDRYGPRWFAAGGFILAVPPLVCLRFVEENSLEQKVLLCALLAIIGLALSSTLPSLMSEITYVVDAKEEAQPGVFGPKGAYAQAYGLFNTAFAGGCLVGPLWGGLIQEQAGWATMAWTLGLLSGVSAVPLMMWVGGWIGGAAWKRKDRGGAEARSDVAEKV